MAKIQGGTDGAGQLEVRIDVLQKAGDTGWVSVGPALMNAEFGVVLAYVSFHVGQAEIFGHHLLLHKMSVQGWASQVESLVGESVGGPSKIYFGDESPELIMNVRRYGSASAGGGPFYEMLIALDAGLLAPDGGITGEGPAVYLEPEAKDILQFARQLKDEVEAVLKLGESPAH